jgi:C_GCAxxG_C_C family probable redox protein
VLLAVGERFTPWFSRDLVRSASGFAGGIGRSRDDVCGALAGGVMAIGLLCGRGSPETDDTACLELVKQWRDGFVSHFGTHTCRPIFDMARLPGAAGSCAPIAGQAAALLATLLLEAGHGPVEARPNGAAGESHLDSDQ